MKKQLLVFPLLVILLAGCSPRQETMEKTQENTVIKREEAAPQDNPKSEEALPPADITNASKTGTYSNKEYGFMVKYPAEFTLKTPEATGLLLPDGTGNYLDRFGVDVVLFTLPMSFFPKNSGIVRADVLIAVNDSVSGGEYSFSAVDKTKGVPPPVIETLPLKTAVTMSGITWGMAEKIGAAAGTKSHVKIYHTNYEDKWYEVQLNLWTASDGSMELSSPDSVWQKLETILSGFQFVS